MSRGREVVRAWARRLVVAGAVGSTLVAGVVAPPPQAAADDDFAPVDGETRLYLVTLHEDVGATGGTVSRLLSDLRARHRQDAVLDLLGGAEPVYRWTSALNGFAVRLDDDQVDTLAGLPEVALVEPNEVRPLAGTPADRPLGPTGRTRGGGGVVIGVVDTGLAPDNPSFAQRQSAGGGVGDFGGACVGGDDWDAAECNGKVVGARWYVDGFGADSLRATAVLSPRDTDGHGTQMSSIAAGNAGVPVRVGGERLGRFGGLAPEARLAVYKACWSAPDPERDGCATADLVTAIDDATRDGVDVLSLSVGGPPEIDTVELALLGATEAGVVVTAAAGNDTEGDGAVAAHPAPWVTTVGGASGDARRGRVVFPGGRRLAGAMLSQRAVGPARVWLGADVRSAGARRADARVCAPGSLDAARVSGAVVVCARGRVGRVDKSRAVALADGAAMVLVNRRHGLVAADIHSVPTVHLDKRPGRQLVRWARAHPGGRLRLEPQGTVSRRPRVAEFSATGVVTGGVVKPDVLAPASGVLGAVPSGSGGSGWGFVSGTSAATAYTAGVAATLLGRGSTAGEVRSALVTTARPIRSSPVLHGGAGSVRGHDARRPGLAYLVAPGAYRAWFEGRRTGLNTPSVVLTDGSLTARRTVTNVTGRRLYFSSSARGFRRDVVVTPAAVRLGPGESVTFRVRVSGRGGARLDDGYVVWRGATGTVTRIPVVVAR